MKLDEIRKLSINYPGGMRKLSSDIGMSEANLHRCVNKNRIQAEDLEKIAELLGVSIEIFFDRNINKQTGKQNEMNVLKEINSQLELRIADKDAQLADKERIIRLLLQKCCITV